MATIKSQLVLNDGMTGPLKSINKALNLVISNFEAAQRASGRAIDTASITSARAELGRANRAVEEIEQNLQDCDRQQDSFNNRISAGTSKAGGLLSKIKGIAATYLGMKGMGAMVGLSDELTSAKARLELIVDDNGSVEELQRKIYASAQSARASYTDTMATIAKLGLVAGKAFSNNDELVKFSELVNKNFVVGGASATEQASAMYQLTQALGSGRLQGDEYRSIIENAPLLAKSIEDYMRNVQGATGTMKDWASEGMLTADVIKAAVFRSADEVEERFKKMPMTWGQVWTSMKNRAIKALDPVLQKINELANDKEVQTVIDNIITNVGMLANWVLLAIDLIVAGVAWLQEAVAPINQWFVETGQRISDNWSTVAPVINAVALALVLLAGVFLIYKNCMAIATAAQWLYNTALFGCPLVWILVIIIAVIAAVYGIVTAINKVTGSTISATGVIMGSLATAGAFIWDLILGLFELILGVINYLVNPIIAFVNFFGNVFNDPIGAIINLFGDLADNVLAVLQKIASAIDFVFGSNMADTIQNWRNGLSDLVDIKAKQYGNGQYEEIMGALDLSVEDLGLKRISYSDAWSAGYKLGEDFESGIANFNIDSLLSSSKNAVSDYGLDNYNTDYSSQLGNIGDDTSSIAGSMATTTEDLKYMRDLAEQEVINRFTTAEVKIDMTGMTNRIDSNMDLDGVITTLTTGFAEALETAAEGVHV